MVQDSMAQVSGVLSDCHSMPIIIFIVLLLVFHRAAMRCDVSTGWQLYDKCLRECPTIVATV